MKIKNYRLIINEEEISESCERIREILQNKLDSLGYGNVIVSVEFCDECYNDNMTRFWNSIEILLLTSEGYLGSIDYVTEGYTPLLTLNKNDFEFYYVFEYASSTRTSLNHMKNIGHCDFDENYDYILEDILLAELEEQLTKENK